MAIALGVSAFWLLLVWAIGAPTGLARSLYREPAFAGGLARVDVVPGIDLDFTERPHGPRRLFSARWVGIWYVERAGSYDFFLSADDRALLRIDGEALLERDSTVGFSTVKATRTLAAGPHEVVVDYEQVGGRAFLNAGWAPAGAAQRPFAEAVLFPSTPTTGQVRINTWLRLARDGVVALWLAVLLFTAWPVVRRVRGALREEPQGWRGLTATWWARLRQHGVWLAPVAAGFIVVAAAALRFETICLMYGPFEEPAWLFELEAHTRARIHGLLRPVEFHLAPVEHPYAGGDPINYLRFARDMTSFYAAHVREPLFPFVTKLWLALLADQNVAVSFASAMFSTLAVLATYLLGSYAFSRPVGLLAALALAIERDAIAWAAEGWRDDAMMCVFVGACYACVRCVRRPTMMNALGLGGIAGLACLTRITTLSFLLPALVWVAWAGVRRGDAGGRLAAQGGGRAAGEGSRRSIEAGRSASDGVWRRPHLRAAAIALLVMLAVAGPYIINCALVFGDPLYAINYHTTFYRARAGLSYEQPMSVGAYLGAQWRSDPLGVFNTFVQGVTTVPFAMKWVGFHYWSVLLMRVLKWSSLIGLVLFLRASEGRWLLVLLVASLVPYAFTWPIPGGAEWRFTMHAYPLYLIAAALALTSLFTRAARYLRAVVASRAPATSAHPVP